MARHGKPDPKGETNGKVEGKHLPTELFGKHAASDEDEDLDLGEDDEQEDEA